MRKGLLLGLASAALVMSLLAGCWSDGSSGSGGEDGVHDDDPPGGDDGLSEERVRLWVAAPDALHLLDASGQHLQALNDHGGIVSLAIDARQDQVWAFDGDAILVFDAEGRVNDQVAITVDTPAAATDSVPGGARFPLDVHDNTAWLAVGKGLHRIDGESGVETTVSVEERVHDLRVTPDGQRLWVATDDTLSIRDVRTGYAEATIHLVPRASASAPLRTLTYDPVHDGVWVSGDQGVELYDADGDRKARIESTGARHLIADHDGGIWLARRQAVRRIDASGLVRVDRPDLAQISDARPITGLAEAGKHGAWLSTGHRLVQLDADGSRQHEVALSSMDESHAIASLVVLPAELDLSWEAPEQDAHVNTTRPTLVFTAHPETTAADNIHLFHDGSSLSVSCQSMADGERHCELEEALPEGPVTLAARLVSGRGAESERVERQFTVDTVAPELTVTAPENGLITAAGTVTVSGHVEGSAAVTVAGDTVDVAEDGSFTGEAMLNTGVNTVVVEAEDRAGNVARETREVILQTDAPAALDVAGITVSGPDASGKMTVEARAGTAEPGTRVIITNERTGERVTAQVREDGSFLAHIEGEAEDTYSVQVQDQAGNAGEEQPLPDERLPADPARLAPELEAHAHTPFAEQVGFLYAGQHPIQRNVASGTISDARVAVIRGQVRDRSGAPLPGVEVRVLNRPEYGHTVTRADGMFDLAVNGGGVQLVEYRREGHLTVQRQVRTRWHQYSWAEDVVMTPLDDKVTTIDFTDDSQPFQVASGSEESDADGARRAVVLFPAGTTATMELPDGSQEALPSMDFRATEYTVGENGPAAMPGELPPASGYTYAVELNADEAIEAGATSIQFSQPVPFYVDNFLDFPAGEAVPVGYYDRQAGAWKANDDGRVIDVLEVTGGRAVLDVAGEEEPATQEELDSLGITETELEEIARRYEPGDSIWRSRVEHFTAWDKNWPVGPPDDAHPPKGDDPPSSDDDEPPEDDECEVAGCIIGVQSQTLKERLAIVGMSHELWYTSKRAAGRTNNEIVVPLDTADHPVPDSTQYARVEVSIVGDKMVHHWDDPTPGQDFTFTWDGTDAYGRPVYGSRKATVTVIYGFACVAVSASAGSLDPWPSWAFPGNPALSAIGTRDSCEGIRLSRTSTVRIQSPSRLHPADLGGWALDVHHAYDPRERVLETGDGRTLDATYQGRVLQTVAELESPADVTVSEGGDLIISGSRNYALARARPDGTVQPFAASDLGLDRPRGISGDGVGGVYVADMGNRRIVRISASGVVEHVMGTGESGRPDHGAAAAEAPLSRPVDVAHKPGQGVYVADRDNHQIYRVEPDGMVSIVAGSGSAFSTGDGGMARDAGLARPVSVAVSDDGEVFIAELDGHRVRRLAPEGTISTVAGTGATGNPTDYDGYPATDVPLGGVRSVAYDEQESVLYVSTTRNSVHGVGPRGSFHTYIGNDDRRGHNGNSATVELRATGLAVGADGRLVAAASSQDGVVMLDESYPGAGRDAYYVPAPDRSELYVFDASGRHVRTLDPVTEDTIRSFEYDHHGRLVSVADAHGNAARIERNAASDAQAIVGPYGQRTYLSLDTNGYLEQVTDPLGRTHRMTYTADGLLRSFVDPEEHVDRFQYNDTGRLTRNIAPNGGGWVLDRSTEEDHHEVTLESAEGRETSLQFPVGAKSARTIDYRNTGPSGAEYSRSRRQRWSLSIRDDYPDGTSITERHDPDPQFGAAVPVVESRVVNLSDGPRRETHQEREVSRADGELTTFTEQWQLNDHPPAVREFDASERRWRYTSPAGRTSDVQLNDAGQVQSVEQSGTAPATYEYDLRGRLTSMTRGNGAASRTTTLEYHDSGRQNGWLAAVTDPMGREVAFEYDSAGRVTHQTLFGNREVRFFWDGNNNLTGLAPPGRSAHVFEYDGVDQKTAYDPPEIDGVDAVTRYHYNLDRQLTTVERPDGDSLQLDYDDAGRLGHVSGPDHDIHYAYSPETDQLTSLSTSTGVDLALAWNGFLPASETWSGPVAGRVERGYNSDFRVETLDIAGMVIPFEYDPDGLIREAGDLALERDLNTGLIADSTLGLTGATFTHNSHGELAAVGHDGVGERALDVTRTEAVVGVPTLEVTGSLAGAGRVEVNGEELSVEDGQFAADIPLEEGPNTLQVRLFDAKGNVLRTATESVEYALPGERVERLQVLSEHIYFDTGQGPASRIPRAGGLGEQPLWLDGVRSMAEASTGDLYLLRWDGSVVRRSEGEEQQIARLDGVYATDVVVGPGNEVYVYASDIHRIYKVSNGETEAFVDLPYPSELQGVTVLANDQGLLVGTPHSSNRIHLYTPDGEEQTYHQADFDRMDASTDGYLCYIPSSGWGDPDPTSVECRSPSGDIETRELGYTPTDLSVRAGGELYLARDNRILRHDGSTETQLRELEGEEIAGALEIEAEVITPDYFVAEYERDALGRITERTESVLGETRSYRYDYDGAGRLESVTVDGAEHAAYSYDANGNRIAAAVDGETVTAEYDAQDRLVRYGDTHYQHDANGDLQAKTTAEGTTTYAYDIRGNLRRVELPDGQVITYVIDGRDRRIGKQVDGELEQGYLYQDQLNPVAELDGDGNAVSRFVYAEQAHAPSYMIRDGERYRIITDHLGSPRVVVHATTGEVAQRLDYDAFGQVTRDTNPGFQPFGFAGGIYDRDTGLVRFGARDYDPETGRWTAKDPIRFGGGDTNLYGYVLNDPVNLLDPMGLRAYPGQGVPGVANEQPSSQEEADSMADPLDRNWVGVGDALRESANNPHVCMLKCSAGASAQGRAQQHVADSVLERAGELVKDLGKVCVRMFNRAKTPYDLASCYSDCY